MRWGPAHEVNPTLLTLIDPGVAAPAITIIKGLDEIKLQECSLVLGDVAKHSQSPTHILVKKHSCTASLSNVLRHARTILAAAASSSGGRPFSSEVSHLSSSGLVGNAAVSGSVDETSSWSNIPAHY